MATTILELAVVAAIDLAFAPSFWPTSDPEVPAQSTYRVVTHIFWATYYCDKAVRISSDDPGKHDDSIKLLFPSEQIDWLTNHDFVVERILRACIG